MWRKVFPLLAVCLVCLFSINGQTLNEQESSVILNETAADLSIVLENPAKSFETGIEIELLDAENKTVARTAQNLILKKGKETYKIRMPLGDLMKKANDEIAWYRLRYRVGKMSGIISLSELIKDVFELRVAAAETVHTGQNYRVRVRAMQPFTKSAVKNVRVEGKLVLDIDTEDDEDELTLKARGETDGDGFAVLDFKIPEDVKLDYDGNLKIVGKKNGITRELEEDLETDEKSGSVFITIDKPLYQPGQTFNARGLYLDTNNFVVSGNELEFSVKDEDDTVLYRETVKTSEYGIASVSWKIPENAKLGSYRVEIENDDGDEVGYQYFKVSRYDLPQFTVTPKSDKTFYLPDDKVAEISVSANYLFGKPVTKGKVRVVQESERRWNYREQKYEIEEKQRFEGTTDADGKFVVKVDLTEEFQELQKSSWLRFEDLNFAAYFTDSTTNRTEQRRFDIRLTKEPIHIYFIEGRNSQHPDLPITGYISTFYADGTPAVCDVEIKGEDSSAVNLKTNSLGAGKLEFNIKQKNLGDRYYSLKITARDNKSQTGTFSENMYLDREAGLKIELEKTIFKPGESLKINFLSTQKDELVYLDIVKDWSIIESRFVTLENGKGAVKIPYNPAFKGDLIVSAYIDLDRQNKYYSYYDLARASRGIIFPEQQNLKLDAQFSAASYKPNEEAKVKFSVLDGAGKPSESALGVVVFDKAIEERARTDAEFGSYFSRYYSLLGYSKAFGGITLKDLNELNLSKPISPELQLAAEIMLADNYYYPRIYRNNDWETDAKSLYSEFFKKQFAPVEDLLKKQFEKNYEHPTDEASLRKILDDNGVNFDDLRDPWGKTYLPEFSTQKTQNILTLKTAGADKKLNTKDDFTISSSSFTYFTPVSLKIDKTVQDYHKQTGRFIRDFETLRAELARQDFDLSKLKDRWNRDYRIDFKVLGRNYQIVFRSSGANGYYEPNYWNSDDFDVWTNSIDYFAEIDIQLNNIFSQTVNGGKRPFPKDDMEFKQILKENDLDFSRIKDGYGQPVYLTYDKKPRYADKTIVENGKQKITPVTEEVLTFYIRSNGMDRIDSRDDFTLTSFSGVLSEQSKDTKYETKDIKTISFSGSSGAIRGTVLDQNGAIIPNATVTATDENDGTKTFSTKTNDQGVFLLENLPSGRYTIKIDSANFKSSVYTGIQVRSQNLVEIRATLEIGTVSEVVNVSAEPSEVNTSASMVQTTVTKTENPIIKTVEQTSTPRLREYFPETLVWSPEIITDKNGKAELKFKMADNITTWKLYTVASTKKGKIGIAEKEVQAFQPFFVDLEPPRFLTDGDEIFLPAQIRNYTDKKQKVDVSMAESDWFDFLGSEKQQIEVASGASENAVFGFKAMTPVKDGKQRVTAIAPNDSDAIEKPVSVRPNGQEIVRTETKLFRQNESFDINFPANALAKTPKAELKIYPNLMTHVSESVEGLLQRPYGCGEQTISSTYPNLMIIKFGDGEKKGVISENVLAKAKKNLQKGYERLLGYQVADGGFSYWGGKNSSDVALTAYAIRFLTDARGFVEVDENVIEKAQDYLLKQQRADGSWTKIYSWEKEEDPKRTKIITSYVAKTLATPGGNATVRERVPDETSKSLQKALAYLKTRNTEIDEPYALALYGLASLGTGNSVEAGATAERLRKMPISEGNTVYWNLETNTPFYGWGTAGRIETTALVLQFLIRLQAAATNNEQRTTYHELISKGTMFLLKNKDRYGVWYSTQTTINVLDAFLATLAENGSSGSASDSSIRILLNGAELQNISVSADQIAPITIDLKDKLNPAANHIEITSSTNSAVMSQIVASHYIDWRDAKLDGSGKGATDMNRSRQLRLDYKCDKQTAEIMQEVSCNVEAERIGFRGYGMLLVEIGLPPGADVDRESLEKAFEADWSLSRYDVLPDRIVVYMWSKAGGSKFDFSFKPRYGINAQTPASVLYDYYNEEAKATIAPLRFTVK